MAKVFKGLLLVLTSIAALILLSMSSTYKDSLMPACLSDENRKMDEHNDSKVTLFTPRVNTNTSGTDKQKHSSENGPPVNAAIMQQVRDKLISTIKYLKVAQTHVRGMKTATNLKLALTSIHSMSKLLNIDSQSSGVITRPIRTSENVCPEYYKGIAIGNPLYYNNHVTTNCTYGKPLENLLTVLLKFNTQSRDGLSDVIQRPLDSITKNYPRLRANLGVDETTEFPPFLKRFSYIDVEKMSQGMSSGKVWNKLLETVQTEYVLIGRGIDTFNEYAPLERLIREIERLDVVAAGGSFKDPQGHWRKGCHQMAYRNASLIYKEGYDESIHECIFCDHIDGPFVIKTSTAKKIKFDVNIGENGVFEDFFLRLYMEGKEAVVCPDIMFNVVNSGQATKASQWQTFAKKWHLSTLKMMGQTMSFNCPKTYTCSPPGGVGLSECCVRELSKAIKFVMEVCKNENIFCELNAGTALGAVKFNSVLPWEKDADIWYLSDNYTALHKIHHKFKDAGYRVKLDPRKHFLIYSKHWKVEVWSVEKHHSAIQAAKGLPPTYVRFDGVWLPGPANPGLNVRNRYRPEIYKHAEHVSGPFAKYKTANTWPTCKLRLHQDCLDQYNTDGSLQFQDPIP